MKNEEKFHKAAKIIRSDGVEGYRIAVDLVGQSVAKGMLVIYLHGQANTEGGCPDKDDTEEKVNKILKDNNIKF